MGDFTKWLGGWAGNTGNAVGTALGGSLVSSLFGPSIKTQLKWQREQQELLNQHAAMINYQYGEKSAENAFKRQMEMYERQTQDQSYASMRKQMENAGLSIGLMYGGAGGSGGGVGSMSGAPQGATGGAVAGDAASGMGAAIQMRQMKLQEAMMLANVEKTKAETANIEKDTEGKDDQSAKTRAETKNIIDIGTATLEGIKQDNESKWLDNQFKRFTMRAKNASESIEAYHKDFGKIEMTMDSLIAKDYMVRYEEQLTKKSEVESANALREAQRVLTDEKTQGYAIELMTGMVIASAADKNADAAVMNANTKRMEVAIQKMAVESGIRLNEAQIGKITEELKQGWVRIGMDNTELEAKIRNMDKNTEWNTGGWAKFSKIMDGLYLGTASLKNLAEIPQGNAKAAAGLFGK